MCESLIRIELPKPRPLRFEDQSNTHSIYCFEDDTPTADVGDGCDLGVELAAAFAAYEGFLRSPAYDTLLVYEEQDDGGTHIHVRLRASTSTRAHYDDDGEPEFRLDAPMDPFCEWASSLNVLDSLVPRINIDAIHFLDLGEIGTDEYVEVGANEVRESLAPFTSVSTVMLNSDRERRHILALRGGEDAEEVEGGDLVNKNEDDDGEDEDEDEDSANETDLPLPAVQHLIVQDLTGSYKLSFGGLHEAWSKVLAILKERKRAGHPIRYLTLSESEAFPNFKGEDLLRIKARDREYLRRAEGLVDKIFDSRGYDQNSRGAAFLSGRISEYVQEL
ncbi:hypothetical protein PENSPDRAFT_655712 [Peniophora sp. CONT]|nr:hypothetical protein PENSPDRAFT_655712 [Peniophora sp. CONT]